MWGQDGAIHKDHSVGISQLEKRSLSQKKYSGFFTWLREMRTGPGSEPGSLVLWNTNAKHTDTV